MSTRTRATGHIEVTSYVPVPFDAPEGAPALNELHVTEIFKGDIDGQGAARMLQVALNASSASFCAVERVSGSLAGRSGTFVLQDEGTLTGTRVSGRWFVVPGSATGDLRGLRGEGSFEAELGQHASYVLDYWFE
jgi:hypothetical protein